VAIPIAFRRRLFLAFLSASTLVVAIAMVVTILRLGIFLTPVIILQVLALVRTLDGAKVQQLSQRPGWMSRNGL